MKKIALFFTLFIILVQTAHTQIKWEEYSESYPEEINEDSSLVRIILAIRETNNSFWVTNNYNDLKGSLSNDSLFNVNRPGDFIARTTFDTCNAHFFLHGVNKKNAKEYEFRVLEGQTKIVIPWTDITKFSTESVHKATGQQFAYLGGYKTKFGSYIIVDVRIKRGNKILTSAVVRWVPIAPVLLNIYTANELKGFLKQLQQSDPYRLSAEETNKWKQQYPDNLLDNITGLPKKLKIAS